MLDALKAAYTAKRPGQGLLHHSDRGSQYTSKEYVEQLRAYGMESSMRAAGETVTITPVSSLGTVF